MKLLLVEDEKTLNSILKKGLEKLSYAIDSAFDGEEALELFFVNEYDLVILDLNLPKINGLEVLKKIREKNKKVKVIILSAKNRVEDKIIGLDLGANDYLEKPFDFLELSARIRNLLRWNFVSEESSFSDYRLYIDFTKQQVLIDNQEISLTKKEYSILEYLIKHKDKYISSEELMEHIWDSNVDLFSNTLKYHIHSLKKKLGVQDIIQNERGKGYRYVECEEK